MRPRSRLPLILGLVMLVLECAATSLCNADDEAQAFKPPQLIEYSQFIGAEHPAQFDEIKIDGYAQLEGSIAVEDKGAKITYAPFLLSKSYTFLSETRFQLSQKDTVTTAGLGVRYNPVSPRTKRGGKLWNDANEGLPLYPLLEKLAFDAAQKGLAATLTDLAAKRAAALTKLDGAADDKGRIAALGELARLQLEHDATLGDLRQKETVYKERLEAFNKAAQELYLKYQEDLLDTRLPVVSVGYTNAFFQVLQGDSQDKNANGLDDNYYSTKQRALSLAVDWRFTRTWQLSTLVSYSRDRAAAEQNSKRASMRGLGVTIGKLWNLNESAYREAEEFKKTLFRPGVVLAAAYERSDCMSAELNCKDAVVRTETYTPFVDVKIKKEAQFRIGLPLTRKHSVIDAAETTIGVVSLYSIQLGLPK